MSHYSLYIKFIMIIPGVNIPVRPTLVHFVKAYAQRDSTKSKITQCGKFAHIGTISLRISDFPNMNIINVALLPNCCDLYRLYKPETE